MAGDAAAQFNIHEAKTNLSRIVERVERGDEVKDRLDRDPDVFVSAVSVWEVAIKHAAGKLRGPADLP